MRTKEEDLTHYLSMVASMHGDRESVDGWLLKHGQFFPHADRPASIPKMEDKQCFANAFTVAMDDHSLRYCEGYATSFIPVLHAWCITEDGDVVDPTWGQIDADYWPPAYFGVAFDLNAVAKQLVVQEHYGILPSLWMSKTDPTELLQEPQQRKVRS